MVPGVQRRLGQDVGPVLRRQIRVTSGSTVESRQKAAMGSHLTGRPRLARKPSLPIRASEDRPRLQRSVNPHYIAATVGTSFIPSCSASERRSLTNQLSLTDRQPPGTRLSTRQSRCGR
jgi:hypothetical protein